MLGIRSIIAVPIRLGDTVVGLLEVFSSKAHAFNDRDGTILQRLADTVLAARNRTMRARVASPPSPPQRPPQPSPPQQRTQPKNQSSGSSVSFVPPSRGSSGSYPFAAALEQSEEDGHGIRFPERHLVLLLVAAVSIVTVLGYLLAPWVSEKLHPTRPSTVEAARPVTPAPAKVNLPSSQPLNLDEVRKRAELGDPYEQVALATRYAMGEEVPQDYAMAMRWFLRAAEQGHAGAQDTLGAYYYLGRGAPKDVMKAYFWSLLARASGKSASKDRVAFMTSQLTRGQAQAIQREANNFLKQHPPLMNSESTY
jgi:hypothetical protein